MQAYCIRCRSKREATLNVRLVVMKDGKLGTTAPCPVCGWAMWKIDEPQNSARIG